MNVAAHIVERLQQWGIHRVYGYPGDGIGGVLVALDERSDEIQFVQVRHEETAGFAATADVKYGGSPIGCCVVTSGPGALHALNGVYDALLDRVPVVAVLGQTASTAIGGGYYQEIDLHSVYKDVGAAYLQTITDPAQVEHVVDRACRTALAARAPVVLIVPSDVQEKDAAELPDAHGYIHTGTVPSTTPGAAQPADVARAAEVLNAGERVALLVGAGALGCTDLVTQVADRLGAGAAKALLGKPVLDDRLGWVTGAIGLLGTTASWELMRNCDTLLIIGSNMPYSEYYPAPGQARAVQLDIDGTRNGRRYPTEVNLTGDAGATLAALLPLLTEHDDTSWREQVAGWKQRWDAYSDKRATAKARPINPETVVRGISERLTDDAMVAVDCGTATSWYARDLAMRPSQLGSLSGLLLSMGGGMPYAIAAKMAHPDRPVLAMIGDGAMQMNGVNELITVQKYWRQWADPRFVVLVLNNRDLSFVSWETRALGAVPGANSSGLPDVPYAGWAELLGLAGERLEKPKQIDAVLDRAFAARTPFVIDAVVDPSIPLVPPHLTADQVLQTAKAEFRGDPAFFDIVAAGARETVGAVLRRHNPFGDKGEQS